MQKNEPYHLQFSGQGIWQDCMGAYLWALHQDITHCVFLDDDVILCPNFLPSVRNLVSSFPEDAIGLWANSPRHSKLSPPHIIRWSGGPAGLAYVLPVDRIRKRLEFMTKLDLNGILMRNRGPDTWNCLNEMRENAGYIVPYPTFTNNGGNNVESTWFYGQSSANKHTFNYPFSVLIHKMQWDKVKIHTLNDSEFR